MAVGEVFRKKFNYLNLLMKLIITKPSLAETLSCDHYLEGVRFVEMMFSKEKKVVDGYTLESSVWGSSLWQSYYLSIYDNNRYLINISITVESFNFNLYHCREQFTDR